VGGLCIRRMVRRTFPRHSGRRKNTEPTFFGSSIPARENSGRKISPSQEIPACRKLRPGKIKPPNEIPSLGKIPGRFLLEFDPSFGAESSANRRKLPESLCRSLWERLEDGLRVGTGVPSWRGLFLKNFRKPPLKPRDRLHFQRPYHTP
jgi:hypothetical protein